MTATKSSFRPDVEGLRAIAVLLVIAFHAGLPVSGGYVGVDVFFVISGFLITGLLLREAEANGRISFVNFYARRARRLLPAASTTLLATILLCWWLAPPPDTTAFSLDVVAAAAYFVNWRFASRSVDYLAEDLGRSPVLHFWSLSVEEQFYLIWPLLIGGAFLVARRAKLRPRPTTALTLALVLVPSFVWSILFTDSNPQEAFFVTATRLWELGVGAVLSLGMPLLMRFPAHVGPASTWVGMALIAASAVWFDNSTPWPGIGAGAPTLGAALVIFGGTFDRWSAASRALATGPMVWVGGLSYSIYLWHWPFVVAGQDWLELEGAGWASALVVASLIPAWLSYRFVERPLRFARTLSTRPLASLSLGANLSFASVVAGLLLARSQPPVFITTASNSVRLSIQPGKVVALPATLGAGALGNAPRVGEAGVPRNEYPSVIPEPSSATEDIPRAYAEGCQVGISGESPHWCEIGDPHGKHRAVVLGDSKIVQYFEAIDAAGKALRWKIQTVTKSACPFANAGKIVKGRPYEACQRFNEAVMSQLQAAPPDAVITSQNDGRGFPPGDKSVYTQRAMIRGLVSHWTKLRNMGIQVVVLFDNPSPQGAGSVYRCLLKQPHAALACSFPRQEGIVSSAAPTQRAAAALATSTEIIDLTDYICPKSRCAPVIGNVLVYRQGSHITNTYAKTLAPILTRELRRALKGVGH